MDRSIAIRPWLASLLSVALLGTISNFARCAEPAANLDAHGFEKFGSRWVLPEEIGLKHDLDMLDDIVRRTITLKRQISLAAEENREHWQKQQSANKLIDEIAALMRRNAVGTDEEKKVQKQIEQLKKASRELRDGVAPDRLGGQPHMRAMLEALTLMHQQAAVLTARIETRQSDIRTQYRQLPREVSKWISLQPECEVGPLFRPEQIDQARRKAQASIGMDDVPLFLQGKQKRVGIVLNDQFPSIVTVESDTDRLVVTSNMAFSAGVKNLGPLESVTLPGGYQTKARSGRVQRIRIGSATLQDVSVVVLQPSDEHLGGILGLKVLQAWKPQFADSGISLSLDSSNHASTASN
ncbi:hypothetical protein DTL21_03575 [Bremerella cremea]|uniref:Uncharacterized protein n=1 Tax=Blastopirellula marina TaxID=124 RepID=A0A2S8G5V0_9BACT|nr:MULTISPECIES: aspartyl protease family protein [Pirellulaceae]PQO39832.1 hypothetical protein C5Y83_03575 [Blastopirellula marina]RCS51298.1 hypothetical protein DTL21_03575 [Bremerella cremea]